MPSVRTVRPIIGMEIHVELRTRRKMFASAANPAHPEFEHAGPNELIDPVVLALPGALPTINREAVAQAIRVGLALGCKIARRTLWDRKSYFYPDLPKAYQISQLDHPLCGPGVVTVRDDEHEPLREIRITRAHLEEDAGKLMHEGPGGQPLDHSIVDLNRAGVPLLEIVTEPDFQSADECVRFARQLRDLVRWIGASEANMQKGHMRFEPNINCELTLDDGSTVRTPIVEVKNLNSFRSLGGAIEYELKHQPSRYLEDARVMGRGAKTTRGWDDTRLITLEQRSKEDADDYRYFPDPDIPEFTIDPEWVEELRGALPKMPGELAREYEQSLGLAGKEARALVSDRAAHDLFTSARHHAIASGVDQNKAGTLAANLVLQTAFRLANEKNIEPGELGISPEQLGQIVALRAENAVSAQGADSVFEHLCTHEGDAKSAAESLGVIQVQDEGQLRAWCQAAIDDPANAAAVADLKAGKQQAVGRLMGSVMKQSGSRADAKAARELILELLS